VRDHVSREFTILREDAFAFPVVGTPSAAARRAAPRPGFTFDVRVTVPRGLVVAAGGEDEGRTSNAEKTTYRFGSRVPVPFLNVAIAAYDVTERDGVRLYAFHEDAEGARRVLERVGAAVKLLGAWLGPPASPPRFTIFEIPDGWGSQAHLVAGVMQTAAAFRDAGKLGELYHELSHLWNPPEGDAPSPRWNEGLAMFLQRRLADALDGGASVAEAEKRVASRVLEDASSSRLDAVPLADYGRQGMTDHSYSVAFLWFAVLSRAAGEERMLAALRDVFQAHMKSGLSTRELLAGLESRLGRVARDVDADWVTSVAWVAKLRAAGSVDALARTYASKAEERGP
jgi:aminopeptidase N